MTGVEDTRADQVEPGTGTTAEAQASHGRCALAALVFGAALAVASGQSALSLLIVIAIGQAALVVSWVYGTGMPGPLGALVIAGAAAAGADVAVSVEPDRELAPLLVGLGLAVSVMFVHQLARGVVRTRTVESLSHLALLVVAVSAMPCYLQLRHQFDGRDLALGSLLAVGVAMVVGHLADMIWSHPRFDAEVPRGLFAFALGAVAAGAAGTRGLHDVVAFTTVRSIYVSVAIGAVTGLLAIAGAFAVHRLPEFPPVSATDDGRPPPQARPALLPLAQVLLPIALAAPAAYLLCLTGHS